MEPLTIFLLSTTLLTGTTMHLQSNEMKEVKRDHEIETHYLKFHKEAYDAEAALREKQRMEMKAATAYRIKKI